jgi:formyl-CoA transferase
MRFSQTPVRRGNAGPVLGEDSAALLSELGYGLEEIERLAESRVVKIASGAAAS